MSNVTTLGIFAHANAGKTTLTEELLVYARAKKSAGRVDYGDTTTDSLEIEQKRGISVKAAMVTLDIDGRKIQLIDTPGHIDFSSEVERAINVLDGAVLVVSGVEGVEPQTQVIWNILKEKKVPTIIFINKMDRMGADYDRVLSELKSKLSNNIIPIVKVTQDKESLSYESVNYKENLEDIAEMSEIIMEKYLNDEEVSAEEIDKTITDLVKRSECYPVYGGSALLDEGVNYLLHAIAKYLPEYEDKYKKDDFSGYIYNVDNSSGIRELYVKVLSGQLKSRDKILNSEGEYEQIKSMNKINKTVKEKVEVLEPGEIGIISGLTHNCGELIGNKEISFDNVKFVNPLFETTISAVNNEESFKLVQAVKTLNDEDPELGACLNKETGEVTIKLMGALQGEVIKNIIETRFNIDTNFTDPVILQKETPSQTGYGSCGYTRVSSVAFEVRPLPRNSGLVFKSELSTDVLFSKYQKQIEKLVETYSQQGLFGWELTDCEVVLVNGKCDNVGSEPEHFNIATPIALMRALKDANMHLLEPTVDFEIDFPEEYLSQVVSVIYENQMAYDEILKNNNRICIKGNALLRIIIDLPTQLIRATSGHATVIKKPSSFVDSTASEIITRDFYGYDPRNEEEFVMKMQGSFEKLDMAVPKRKKPQKKPNKIRH